MAVASSGSSGSDSSILARLFLPKDDWASCFWALGNTLASYLFLSLVFQLSDSCVSYWYYSNTFPLSFLQTKMVSVAFNPQSPNLHSPKNALFSPLTLHYGNSLCRRPFLLLSAFPQPAPIWLSLIILAFYKYTLWARSWTRNIQRQNIQRWKMQLLCSFEMSCTGKDKYIKNNDISKL